MFGLGKISLRDLAQFCRRLAISLEAGLDIRKVLVREAEGRLTGPFRLRLQQLADMAAAGRPLTEAVDACGSYFPPLFREMVDLGEQTGKLAEVLRRLSEHYESQLRLRGTFLRQIAWPALQLIVAILVIGAYIGVLGMLPPMQDGKPYDMLGLGLYGSQGMAIYFTFIGMVVLAGVLLYVAMQRGLSGTAALQKALLQVPLLGPSLRTLALSRLAWSLHLTLDTGMELSRALPLSLRSTRNARFTEHSDEVVAMIIAGHEIHEVLEHTGAFPHEFLERVEVGEQAGQLPESMGLLSKQYQEESSRALATLTMLFAFAIWGFVALLIIMMIFRMASSYVGVIYDAIP